MCRAFFTAPGRPIRCSTRRQILHHSVHRDLLIDDCIDVLIISFTIFHHRCCIVPGEKWTVHCIHVFQGLLVSCIISVIQTIAEVLSDCRLYETWNMWTLYKRQPMKLLFSEIFTPLKRGWEALTVAADDEPFLVFPDPTFYINRGMSELQAATQVAVRQSVWYGHFRNYTYNIVCN